MPSETSHYGGHSMTAPLARVMVCSPESGGWLDQSKFSRWQELGFLKPPEFQAARKEHQNLCQTLAGAGAEVVSWVPANQDQLSLDVVYVHDASFMTDRGAILLCMGKSSRQGEPAGHETFYAAQGIPILGAVQPPGKVEGGDLVWLDSKTLLAGIGYRTNLAGVRQLQDLLSPLHVEIVPAPLPHGGGPNSCLHLMSLLSMLDEKMVLVDLPWLAVQTVEYLRERGFRLIEINARERDMLACNVLSLGNGCLLAFEENRETTHRLQREGFKVHTIQGRYVGINGGGGPTCLTRPILRRSL
jgi:N-dimethylarginine dimethylaminohydrolase